MDLQAEDPTPLVAQHLEKKCARAELESRIALALHNTGWGTVIEQWFMGHKGPRLNEPEVDRLVGIYLRCMARDVAEVLEPHDGHAFVPDDTTDHGWPSYTCAVCGKRKAEHSDGSQDGD